MQDFLIHQKVAIWQAFTIQAENADDAVAKVKANPSCSDLVNDGIEYLMESESVLATALFNGDDPGYEVLFTHAEPGYAEDLADAALPMPDPLDQCTRLTVAQVTRGWLGNRLRWALTHRADFVDTDEAAEVLVSYSEVEELYHSDLRLYDPEERRKLEYLLAQTDVSYFQIIN